MRAKGERVSEVCRYDNAICSVDDRCGYCQRDRYRAALERIAKGDVFSITQAVDIAWDALKDD